MKEKNKIFQTHAPNDVQHTDENFNNKYSSLLISTIDFLHEIMVRCKDELEEEICRYVDIPNDHTEIEWFLNQIAIFGSEDKHLNTLIEDKKQTELQIKDLNNVLNSYNEGHGDVSNLNKVLDKADFYIKQNLSIKSGSGDFIFNIHQWYRWLDVLFYSTVQLQTILVNKVCISDPIEISKYDTLSDLIEKYSQLYIKAFRAQLLDGSTEIDVEKVDLNDVERAFYYIDE